LRGDKFSHFNRTPAWDERTDGQTRGYSIFGASIASRGQKEEPNIMTYEGTLAYKSTLYIKIYH